MNLWECDMRTLGCTSTAKGTGGAIGLRAIGWWFVPGPGPLLGGEPRLLCPDHRPDKIPCLESFMYPDTPQEQPCSPCKGEVEADKWQELINTDLGFRHHSHTKWLEKHRRGQLDDH